MSTEQYLSQLSLATAVLTLEAQTSVKTSCNACTVSDAVCMETVLFATWVFSDLYLYLYRAKLQTILQNEGIKIQYTAEEARSTSTKQRDGDKCLLLVFHWASVK